MEWVEELQGKRLPKVVVTTRWEPKTIIHNYAMRLSRTLRLLMKLISRATRSASTLRSRRDTVQILFISSRYTNEISGLIIPSSLVCIIRNAFSMSRNGNR